MTQEEKQLLMVDLCGRLPHGVKVWHPDYQKPQELDTIYNYDAYFGGGIQFQCDDINEEPHQLIKCKPYLRPMSSMTEEEDKEWQLYKSRIAESCDELLDKRIAELHDWFCKKHIDYRGLIPMGLALEAPEGMYKTE